MRRGLRIAANLLYAAAFLAGLSALWIGLEALTFGGLGARRGLLALAAGFAIWLALAAATGRRAPGMRT